MHQSLRVAIDCNRRDNKYLGIYRPTLLIAAARNFHPSFTRSQSNVSLKFSRPHRLFLYFTSSCLPPSLIDPLACISSYRRAPSLGIAPPSCICAPIHRHSCLSLYSEHIHDLQVSPPSQMSSPCQCNPRDVILASLVLFGTHPRRQASQ